MVNVQLITMNNKEGGRNEQVQMDTLLIVKLVSEKSINISPKGT